MDQANQANDTSNRRLDSWKEIGAFFNRDERTVRRWEKERSLPVHRMPGKAGGSVYAFTDELSQWLKTPHFIEAWAEEAPAPGADTEPEAEDVPSYEGAPVLRKFPMAWL